MSNSLKQLFQKTYEKAREVQKTEQLGTEIDGRAIWGEIEKSVADFTILDDLKYNQSNLEPIYDKMIGIITKFKMIENEFNPKYRHFFMQLMNLVVNKSLPVGSYKIDIKRVLQLAYNAGQLSVFIDNGQLPYELSAFVISNKLLDLDTYLDLYTQEIISCTNKDKIKAILAPTYQGGNLYSREYNLNYQKYKKYKNKYLKLKNIILL